MKKEPANEGPLSALFKGLYSPGTNTGPVRTYGGMRFREPPTKTTCRRHSRHLGSVCFHLAIPQFLLPPAPTVTCKQTFLNVCGGLRTKDGTMPGTTAQ